MLKSLMDKAYEKNLGIEFVKAYGIYMGSISDGNDIELYSYGSVDFVDMVTKLWDTRDILGDREKEEQLYQEILNNEC